MPSRLVILALALLSLAACSSSRDTARGDGTERIENQLASLNEAVNLTEAQTVRIRAILTAGAADRPSGPPQGGGQGRGGQRGGRPGGESGGADRRAEANRQIEAVLTEDQIERFRAWSTAQAQRRQGPRDQ